MPWSAVTLGLCLMAVSCSTTEGPDSPAHSTVNIDVGSTVAQLTPRWCATPAGNIPYGNGPAGQYCQVMTPWGPAWGQTVK